MVLKTQSENRKINLSRNKVNKSQIMNNYKQKANITGNDMYINIAIPLSSFADHVMDYTAIEDSDKEVQTRLTT